jgi:hypothetical protein
VDGLAVGYSGGADLLKFCFAFALRGRRSLRDLYTGFAPGLPLVGGRIPAALEAGWVFVGYVEVSFECEASVGDGAFVEEAADEGDAMWDAAGGIEFREGFGWVGCPVAAGFGDFDETGAEGEGGVAGEVGDGEDLVAEGGDEEEIDFIHDAGHLDGDHTAETVSLNVVDCGEEAGLAEGVGPGVGDLGFELVELVIEGDLLEGGGRFGEEDEVEVVVRPVGEGDFDGRHAEGGNGGQGGAVYVGGGGFFHPLGEVAYL